MNSLFIYIRRSKWKPHLGYVDRSMVITPKMLDCEFEISNGNSMRKVKITSDHVGHRLGEFYESKSRAIFKKNKK